MITAYAVVDPHMPGWVGLKRDQAAAVEYAALRGATVHKLVEEAPILRKFDGYVPADQASSMRYRIAELENIVERRDAALEAAQAQARTRESALQLAHARLTDMLMGDDGQAWKEAQRVLPAIAAVAGQVEARPATPPGPWSVAARQVVNLMTAVGRAPTEEQEAALSAAMAAIWPRSPT